MDTRLISTEPEFSIRWPFDLGTPATNANDHLPILFNGLGMWAIIDLAFSKHADTSWHRPEKRRFRNNAIIVMITDMVYKGSV